MAKNKKGATTRDSVETRFSGGAIQWRCDSVEARFSGDAWDAGWKPRSPEAPPSLGLRRARVPFNMRAV